MKKPPCKNCLDRKIACHDSCSKFQEYKIYLNNIKERKKIERDKNQAAIESVLRNYKRMKQHR